MVNTMKIVPKLGEGILAKTLNTIGSYVLVTMEEPWKLLNKMLTNKPTSLILNQDMRIENLNDGIKVLVEGQLDEVILCERWGNARPEEGSEHFLAYCLEELTGEHYIHGNLIALNTLVVLKLQRENAVYDFNTIKAFFDKVGVIYCPLRQGIRRKDYKQALETVPEYIKKENLPRCLWSLKDTFDQYGECSTDGILDWAYTLSRH